MKLLAFVAFLVFTVQCTRALHTPDRQRSFLWTNVQLAKYNPEDGERRIWVVDSGFAARETIVKTDSMTEVKLRQVTDGKRLFQLVLVDGELKKCAQDRGQPLQHFLKRFREEVSALDVSEDGALQHKDIHRTYLRNMLQMYDLPKKCRRLKLQSKPFLRHQRRDEDLRRKRSSKHHQQGSKSAPEPLKWCGRGYSAANYSDMGGLIGTDRCCRTHDLKCPYHIPAWQHKYGITNWNFYTLSHCNCDHRFHSCLKRVDTEESHIIGRIFFDILGTKCFTFKTGWECERQSWLGKCLKWVKRKRSVIRDAWSYSSTG